METVKEKLRKVIKKIFVEEDIRLYCRKQEEKNEEGGYLCDDCPYCEKSGCMETLLADRLTQNGVTIQEWVSVDERLPEDGSSVFVMLTHTYESDYVTYGIARYIDTSNGERHWCEDHHGYLEWDKYSDGRGGCSSYKVTRWMPIPVIPQPPKGE